MATRSTEDEATFYAPTGGGHPWWKWFNGDVWKLTPGEDYTTTTKAFRAAAYHHARIHNYRIRTRIKDGYFYLHRLPEEGQ